MNRSPARLTTLVRVVVVAVVLAPLAFVWGIDLLNRRIEDQMRSNVAAAVQEAEVSRSDPGVLARIARKREIHLWIIDRDGKNLLDHDHERRGSRLGPSSIATAPGLTVDALDAASDPPSERPEVQHAFAHESHAQCTTEMGGHLQTCSFAKRIEWVDGREAVIYARDSAELGVQRLPTVQRPLLVLTGIVLVLGLGLSSWLLRRIVRPLERLRREVAKRRELQTLEPIAEDGPPEVAEVARAMNDLHHALEVRTQRNRDFVDDVAHEVKGPIAAMRTCADILGSGAELTPAQTARLSNMLVESGARLDRNVADWLSLARAEAGLPGDAWEILDWAELTKNIVAGYQEQLDSLDFVFDEMAETPVRAVPRELEVAIRNLLDNAISFSPPGGKIHISLAQAGHEAKLEICDEGPGIPLEDQERVFDRFFTRRTEGRGTGLGLSVTKAILQAHRGTIELIPCAKGACFRVTLPMADESPAR